jgi:O-antigen/teichoic acid export membrane protein
LLRRSIKYIFLAVFPIVLTIVTFAPEGLGLWLGPVFAEKGSPVLRWLATAVLLNSLTVVPFVLIQSAGKPDFTGKLCMVELPLYLLVLWVLTPRFGIEGTAFASFARVVCEGVVLFLYVRRLLPSRRGLWVQFVLVVCGALLLLWLGTIPYSIGAKAAFLITSLAVFVVTVWFWGLGSAEKTLLARDRPASIINRA